MALPSPSPPDPWNADLSAIHTAVDNLAVWLAIWAARNEPDPHARRCANDATDAIDATLTALHGLRARLISEIRQADDATAARVDELLARTREGPPGQDAEAARITPEPDRFYCPNPPPPPQHQQGSIAAATVSRDGVNGTGPAPRLRSP